MWKEAEEAARKGAQLAAEKEVEERKRKYQEVEEEAEAEEEKIFFKCLESFGMLLIHFSLCQQKSSGIG